MASSMIRKVFVNKSLFSSNLYLISRSLDYHGSHRSLLCRHFIRFDLNMSTQISQSSSYCYRAPHSTTPLALLIQSVRHSSQQASQSKVSDGEPDNTEEYTEATDQVKWEESNHSDGCKLYEEHIPTTQFQKVLLSVGSALVTITSPDRGDMLAAFGEASGHAALVWIRSQMEADDVGLQILQDQPRINTRTLDLDHLSRLPDNTFGKAYSNWLRENQASPDDRLPVQFVDDVALAYVMQRYREIHDLLHCLLGMPTNMIGEVTVKVFEGIQTRLPMCITGGLFGPVRLGPKHTQMFFSTHLPWALRNGFNAKNVMNVYYEQHWETPLIELRQLLNIEEPPYTPAKKQIYNKQAR